MDTHDLNLLRRGTIRPDDRKPGDVGGGSSRRGELIDWAAWLRNVERKRRSVARLEGRRATLPPAEYYVRATYGSFRLDGISITVPELIEALTRGPRRRQFRSRLGQRARNHAAILLSMERQLSLAQPLRPSLVVRWYTSISCGLSTARLSAAATARLEFVVRRINSPQLRLQPALLEAVALHTEVLAEELVPSFNGILARLLLRYHLGRSGFPPVIFNPTCFPREHLRSPGVLLPHVLAMIEEGYDLLVPGPGAQLD